MKLPILTADQMKQAEKRSFQDGNSPLAYMENAALGIALEVEKFCIAPNEAIVIHLLVGKGNNGGDALATGALLVKKGYQVLGHCLYPNEVCSPLSQKMRKRFEKAGGQWIPFSSNIPFEQGVILDGLLGTGFTGRAEGKLLEAIEMANASLLPIFAIDIPSGLDGNTGAVNSTAMVAKCTLFLGYPKTGFFVDQGWDHVGKLVGIDFKMPEKYIQETKIGAFLSSEAEASALLPSIKRSRHKYEAGYVLAVAGSPQMPGAALLACLATLKTGAGITRLFHPPKMRELLSISPFELIKEEWNLEDPSRMIAEAKRAKALLIGPGMGRDQKTSRGLDRLLRSKIDLPTVIDADALDHLARHPESPLPEKTVLTPHKKEMEHLIGQKPTWEACQVYTNNRKITVVLKGAPTVIFNPHTTPLLMTRGDPGMASAGTGDVLTGMIAALLAQGLTPYDAALVGTTLHGISGEVAAASQTSYGLIASDLINCIPETIRTLNPAH